MYNFSEYNTIIEKLIRVDSEIAYCQSIDIVEGITKFKDIENVFENLRPKEYPSRLTSIRLGSTPDNIAFDKNLPIYEVNISGTIFYGDLRKFNEAIHAEDNEQLHNWILKYWESSPTPKENYSEIILDGTATVLGKIK
tara:strand:- start:7259 stop:7675 length:417 start_codon:yes stop_codon:yes gene_type:complete